MKTLISITIIILGSSILYSQSAKSHFDEGVKKHHNLDFYGAVNEYTKAIELSPKYTEAYLSRAKAKSLIGDKMGSTRDYSKVIELDPNNDDAYDGRAGNREFLKDYSGAINDYTKAIEINSGFSLYYFSRGSCKYQLGDYRGSIQDLTKSIELYDKFYSFYEIRAYSRIELKEYLDADFDLTRAIEILTDSSLVAAQIFYQRGLNRINNLNQRNAGCLDLSKAGELGYKDAYEVIKSMCK